MLALETSMSCLGSDCGNLIIVGNNFSKKGLCVLREVSIEYCVKIAVRACVLFGTLHYSLKTPD